jgi:DNA primase
MYLKYRRFDPGHLVREWGLRGVGNLGAEWSWRIIIPIHNKDGLEVSYTGRVIGETRTPRYLTLDLEKSIESPKSLLYGEQYASETIVVVEGPTDVWRIGRGAVATFGTSWTEEQAARIRKYKTRYIMFDNEKPAQRLARKLADAVSSAPGKTEIITGLVTDPGDLEPEEVDELKKELGLV